MDCESAVSSNARTSGAEEGHQMTLRERRNQELDMAALVLRKVGVVDDGQTQWCRRWKTDFMEAGSVGFAYS